MRMSIKAVWSAVVVGFLMAGVPVTTQVSADSGNLTGTYDSRIKSRPTDSKKGLAMGDAVRTSAVAHLALEVPDLEESMHLFIDLLSFSVAGVEGYVGDQLEWLPGDDSMERATAMQMKLEMVVLQLGALRLNLQRTAEPLDQPRFDHLAIAAREQGFAEVVTTLREQGCRILDEEIIPNKRIMFETASGFKIEVYPKEVYDS